MPVYHAWETFTEMLDIGRRATYIGIRWEYFPLLTPKAMS